MKRLLGRVATVAAASVLAAFTPVILSATPAGASGVFGPSNPAWVNYYNSPGSSSTWGPFCAGGGGSVGPIANGVPSCGPTGGTTIDLPGGGSTPGFQCVELSERYLYVKKGWTELHANGAQVVGAYGSAHGAPIVANATPGRAPQVGDVLSFSANSGFSDTGHTAVVVASSVDGNGNGNITMVSENVTSSGAHQNTLAVQGWRVAAFSGFSYIKWLSLGLSAAPVAQPIHTAVALIPGDGASGYVLDGTGGLHPFGNAQAVSPSVTWPNWDIARAIAVTGQGQGYVLDGYGGLHSFGGAPPINDPNYWGGWDIARAIALCPGGQGGYVLDGWGGVHPIGTANPLSDPTYWSGWDIARAIVVNSTCTGGYVLDGYGGIHPIGNAPSVTGTGYWSGWDIARSITLVTDTSGYVLDGWGGIHPFNDSSTPQPPLLSGAGYQSGSDYRSLVIDPVGAVGVQVSAYTILNGAVQAGQVNQVSAPTIHTAAALIPNDGASGYIVDGYGGLHPFGNAPSPTATTGSWPGWDIARAVAVTAPGQGYVLDGFGGLHSFGGAPALTDPNYWNGWDIARAVALCPGGQGGYVLDGYGGLHPIGNAGPLSDPAYFGWDIARAVVLNSTCTGGYVLDGWGGIHPIGNSPGVTGTGYWPNWDIARSITLVTDTSGYVLDGYGGIHPFNATGAPAPKPLSTTRYDAAGTGPFDAIVYSPTAQTGISVTRSCTNGVIYTATLN